MVRSGLLRGLSIEFYSISERQEQGIRVLDKAEIDCDFCGRRSCLFWICRSKPVRFEDRFSEHGFPGIRV